MVLARRIIICIGPVSAGNATLPSYNSRCVLRASIPRHSSSSPHMEQNSQILAVQVQLLGCFMDWALLGVLTVQVYLYHVNISCDPLFLQILVYVIFILEWLQTINLSSMTWQVFVVDYGQGDALSTIHVGFVPLPIMCSVVSLICMLSKSTCLVTVIMLVCHVFSSNGRRLKDGAQARIPLVQRCVNVTSRFVDVLIAIVMTVLMVKWKTGIAATDRIINKIIRLVVETGSLTASVATVGLVLAIIDPTASYYQPAIYTLTKLTSIAFTSVFVDVEDPRHQERSSAQGLDRQATVTSH
ncbi:uncharacterized protein B0H18DRAFT_1014010 [Fomitopsis serialis]|uniref:uncharacterized protein n=1 Tax=Fomitopsis serialis TaxID=139415 RepID=UPI0020083CC1|nr:uncharacterized protein B0H18DRAFT_1014010 [Neoantrodia serialis]KAH9923900.1 hypothetical protein B0H18DRAFT_1014010 [Neoantrodia serialis]